MSGFKPYPEYKDSGAEWLGEVPVRWDVTQLKTFVRIVNGATPSSGVSDYWDGDIAWFTPADLDNEHITILDTARRTITSEGLASCAAQLCPPNSVVLSTRAPVGNLGVTRGWSSTNQGCRTLIPDDIQSYKWLAYLLAAARPELATRSNGTTFQELSREQLASLRVVAPLKNERVQIARFLDHETARIDALIAEQERLIDLLKEKRQAVISHAVTKGLNPDAPMKDSGVEWLGEVPAHWEVRKLKNLISVSGGSTPSKDEEGYWNGEIPWVTPKDMKVERLYDSIDHVTEQALTMTSLRPVAPGAVLIVVRGMILLHSVPVAINEVEVTINQDMKAMRPLDRLTTHYLLMLMQGLRDGLFQYIDESAHGTKKLEWERFELLDIPLPPVAEQDAIVQLVSGEKNAIDELVSKSLSTINLLRERRTALISAAVTGKIDVRDWQPPADADAIGAAEAITTTEPA